MHILDIIDYVSHTQQRTRQSKVAILIDLQVNRYHDLPAHFDQVLDLILNEFEMDQYITGIKQQKLEVYKYDMLKFI